MLSIQHHLKQTVLNKISVLLSIYFSMYIPHLKEMSLSLLFFSMRISLSYCIKTACAFNYSALELNKLGVLKCFWPSDSESAESDR